MIISTAPRWEAKMFCWLAVGEHEALKRDMAAAKILILAEGKPTITARIFPTESREITLRHVRLPGEAGCSPSYDEDLVGSTG